ncbi:kynureninase [Amycolatopsis pithecellobii]|uniref:Kynureninase n=1 Tax=Amycolatopsis pithecellobii TaxID=664692 RepID=A0A6N7Z9K1_9PSEU|nr:aminotransferase class V-fold PLP-dependent enzyme [Amycolatopsis pithecellobii]MTD58403.1 aminotransferase class V-fold PLP-dependent enzyme [Amycolatopsis pithecellobii]
MSLSAEAAELDTHDPLAGKRAEFDLDPQMSYLDGNSLGAPPRSVAVRLDEVVRKQWAGRLIRAWDEGWWQAPERVGDRIAPLIGAAAGQVVVGDSTSVNVFKALVAAARLNPGRPEILLDVTTFPADGYIAENAARLTGHEIRRVVPEEMPAVVSERTAVALINHVDYRSGLVHELPSLTESLHAAGALVVWDLCHSVGAVPMAVDAAQVDLAVGCTYKFLNGGPGAPAFLYVPTKWQESFDQPLSGWAGHVDPFGMAEAYVGGPGVIRARTGTPDILSMLALDAALDVWDDVTVEQVRAKGLALGDFFVRCLDELVPAAEVLSPRDYRRGNQLSVGWPDAKRVMAAMTKAGIIGDFRPPDVLRFGLAALYVRYVDVLRAAAFLSGWPG